MSRSRTQNYHTSFSRRIRKNWDNYLLMLPFMTLFSLFYILPVISSMGLSFTYFNMLQPPKWRGWLNYARLILDDDVFLIALKNTLLFAFLTGPVSYFLALFLAWFINEMPRRLRAVMTFVFYAPSISGAIFFIWGFIFSGDAYGVVNGLLLRTGIIDEPVQWLLDPRYNLKIIMIIQLWLSMGAGFLAFIAGLQSIDRNLYQAAAVDGVKNRRQELFYITLPSMAPQLLFGAVMQIAASFRVSRITMQLAGFPSTDYSARTIVTHIIDYGTLRFEMGYASSIATVLFFMMIIVKGLITRLLGRYQA